MTFPTRPAIDIPRWCLAGNKLQPNPYGTSGSGGYEDTGWLQISGQNYGQIPPYQWVNWLQYSVGEWLEWLCSPTVTTTTGAIEYIKLGNFDADVNVHGNITSATGDIETTLGNIIAEENLVSNLGKIIAKAGDIEIWNANKLFLYNSANANFASFSASGTTANANYLLPPVLPTVNNLPLICSTTGIMEWDYLAASIILGGTVAPANGFLGAYYRGYVSTNIALTYNTYINLTNTPVVPAGIYDVSGVCICGVGTTASSSFNIAISIHSATGSTPLDAQEGDNLVRGFFTANGGSNSLAIPSYRIVMATAGSIYLQMAGGSISGQAYAEGCRISATCVG